MTPFRLVRRVWSGFSGTVRWLRYEGTYSPAQQFIRGGVRGAEAGTDSVVGVTYGPILVLNGPNLNMLGVREPRVYGTSTLGDVDRLCRETAGRLGRTVQLFQSNSEGVLIDRIHQARGEVSAIVVNPGGLTHTSVALADALPIVEVPVVEVHISNVHAREEFRRHSYISPVAAAVVAGMGIFGYVAAIEYLVQRTSDNSSA